MTQTLTYTLRFLENAWEIWLEVAPWLLIGLILAGLLKVFLPTRFLQRWLGGRGVGPIFKAAVIGTPVPLCSCSVLPTAMQLHRSGASSGATTSFLVATPENGADSIALSYVLLGPVMTVLRPVAAIVSAVSTGLLTETFSSNRPRAGLTTTVSANEEASCCCGDGCQSTQDGAVAGGVEREPGKMAVVTSAAFDLLDDIAGWLVVGIIFAALLQTFVPTNAMAGFGSGLLAMLAIAVLSVPMYICATASTPVAASMLAAGISPGTVLVFLLAGPATNLASAGILRRELGTRVTAVYLFAVVATAILLGLATDFLFQGLHIEPAEQLEAVGEVMPVWISLPAAVVLGFVAVKPLRRWLSRMGSFGRCVT